MRNKGRLLECHLPKIQTILTERRQAQFSQRQETNKQILAECQNLIKLDCFNTNKRREKSSQGRYTHSNLLKKLQIPLNIAAYQGTIYTKQKSNTLCMNKNKLKEKENKSDCEMIFIERNQFNNRFKNRHPFQLEKKTPRKSNKNRIQSIAGKNSIKLDLSGWRQEKVNDFDELFEHFN